MKEVLTLTLAIACYNRLDYLAELLNSFFKYRNEDYNWKLIIHNDKKDDQETKLLLDGYKERYTYLESNRGGIHIAKNKLIKEAFSSDEKCNLLFLAEDDIYFKDYDFEKIYLKAISNTPYKYFCFYDKNWKNANKGEFTTLDNLELKSHGTVFQSQGAFTVMTEDVFNKIGFFDVPSFGFRGIGHLDYSYRACLAGFNNEDRFYDITNSDKFIGMQQDNYRHALSLSEVIRHRANQSQKMSIVKSRKKNKTFVMFNI